MSRRRRKHRQRNKMRSGVSAVYYALIQDLNYVSETLSIESSVDPDDTRGERLLALSYLALDMVKEIEAIQDDILEEERLMDDDG